MSNLNLLSPEAGLLLLILVFNSIPALPQHRIKEIPLGSEVIHAFVDRPGDLYIQLKNEQLLKFNKEGELLQQFSPGEAPTVFEPRDGARTFSFYRKRNLAGFANFGMKPSTPVNEEFAIDPWLVCSAGDQGMWILDKADYTMKRVNLVLSKVEVEFPLPRQLSDNQYIREYQGFLFLLDGQSRIMVFNGFGKLLKTITGNQIGYFNFIGEELYFKDGPWLHFHDLFDGVHRYEPADDTASFILLTDEVRYQVYQNKVLISPVG